jgi:serine/threonine protein kinase
MASLRGRSYAEAGRLGSGAFGSVLRVYDDVTGEERAAKVFEADDDAEVPGAALREVSFMSLLAEHRAPCVAPLLDLAFELSGSRELVAVMPLYVRDLARAIDDKDLRSAARVAVMRDALSALAYLHAATPPIVHRDVKPENLLLDQRNRAFLTDFSLARFVSDGAEPAQKRRGGKKAKKSGKEPPPAAVAALEGSGVVGTPTYLAPEVLREAPPDVAVDLWAAGVTFLELCEGARLETDRDKAALRIIRKKRDALSAEKPVPALLRGLLQEAPAERLPAAQALLSGVFPASAEEPPPTQTTLHWTFAAAVSSTPPDRAVAKACQEVDAAVAHTPVAAFFYRSKAPQVALRYCVAVAHKLYEHDTLPDEDLAELLRGDAEELGAAQVELLRHFQGNLLVPYYEAV